MNPISKYSIKSSGPRPSTRTRSKRRSKEPTPQSLVIIVMKLHQRLRKSSTNTPRALWKSSSPTLALTISSVSSRMKLRLKAIRPHRIEGEETARMSTPLRTLNKSMSNIFKRSTALLGLLTLSASNNPPPLRSSRKALLPRLLGRVSDQLFEVSNFIFLSAFKLVSLEIMAYSYDSKLLRPRIYL